MMRVHQKLSCMVGILAPGVSSAMSGAAANESWPSVIQALAAALQGLAVIGGGVWALFELRRATRAKFEETAEKRQQNRLVQAAAAQHQLDMLWSNAKARSAMRMLDWDGRTYSYEGLEHCVESSDVRSALLATCQNDLSERLVFTPKQTMIRDCFEEFFDRVELLAHYCDIGYLHRHDVVVPLSYYAKIILDNDTIYAGFLETYGYHRCRELFRNSVVGSQG